jgi:hypothetical protein
MRWPKMPPCVNKLEERSMKQKTSKTKICSKCLKRKSRLEFYKSRKAKDGLRSPCKTCYKAKYGNKYNTYKRQWLKNHPEYLKQWAKANPVRRKLINIKWVYNLTPVAFLSMLFEQGFACQDCRTPFGNDRSTRPNIDHDHDAPCCDGYRSCGKCIRGLVCSKCNGERAKKDRIARQDARQEQEAA